MICLDVILGHVYRLSMSKYPRFRYVMICLDVILGHVYRLSMSKYPRFRYVMICLDVILGHVYRLSMSKYPNQPDIRGSPAWHCCSVALRVGEAQPERARHGPGPFPPTSELPRCWLCRVDSARGWDTRWTCLELSQLGMAWEWSGNGRFQRAKFKTQVDWWRYEGNCTIEDVGDYHNPQTGKS